MSMEKNNLRLGVVVNFTRKGAIPLLDSIRQWAIKRHIRVVLGDIGFGYPDGDELKIPVSEMKNVCDVVLVIGGDGTILRAAPIVAPQDLPLVAVNTGEFGFLATAEAHEIHDLLRELQKGTLREETRSLLDAMFMEGGDTHTVHALNDIVIHRGEEARVVKLEVYVDDVLVNRFAADGVIVSTPTGSTAYNLSAGGPVFHPGVDALAITPICAHTLAVRPVVVSKQTRIVLRAQSYEGGTVYLLSDGQVAANLDPGAEVTVQRSSYRIRILQRAGRSFYNVLRKKLGWAGPSMTEPQ